MVRWIKVFIILIWGMYSIVPAQRNSDLVITGGLQYTTWSELDSAINCCLVLWAPTENAALEYPLQVVFLLDASSEMAGFATEQATYAIMAAAKALQDKALVCLITYSSVANTLFRMQPINASTTAGLKGAMDQIRHDQPRNLADGFTKCADIGKACHYYYQRKPDNGRFRSRCSAFTGPRKSETLLWLPITEEFRA